MALWVNEKAVLLKVSEKAVAPKERGFISLCFVGEGLGVGAQVSWKGDACALELREKLCLSVLLLKLKSSKMIPPEAEGEDMARLISPKSTQRSSLLFCFFCNALLPGPSFAKCEAPWKSRGKDTRREKIRPKRERQGIEYPPIKYQNRRKGRKRRKHGRRDMPTKEPSSSR